MELTFEDYRNKKFFVTPDFRTYRWSKKGRIKNIVNIPISHETWREINAEIKSSFFKEVDKKFIEYKNAFQKSGKYSFDMESSREEEIRVVKAILNGQLNTIIDAFGITHEIVVSVAVMKTNINDAESSMNLTFSDPKSSDLIGCRLKLSPVITLQKSTIMSIRRYLKYVREHQDSDCHFITNIEYSNLHEPFVLAEVLIKYLSYLKERQEEDDSKSFVLKNESVIVKLFEEYGSYFPNEAKDGWKKRWRDGNDTLPKIEVDEFKYGNNKHLLLTILNEAFDLLQVPKRVDYIKRKWGLSQYSSDISRYIRNRNAKPHPETKNIREILKSELF